MRLRPRGRLQGRGRSLVDRRRRDPGFDPGPAIRLARPQRPWLRAGPARHPAGDVIVAWGGEDLVDVMDMVERLREHRPGDVVEIVVLRDGEEIELDVTMKASQRNIEN